MKKLLLVLSLLVLTGCSLDKPEPTIDDVNNFIDSEVSEIEKQEKSEEKNENTYEEWTQVKEGMQVVKIPILDEEKIIDTATIFKINPHKYQFKLHQNIDEPKTIHDWDSSLEASHLLILNGSYFNDKNQPTGGYIINDEQYGVLTFDGENGYTSALIANDKKVDLQYLPEQPLIEDKLPQNMIQSFPTLVLPNAQKGIKTDSGKKARRTIIAKDIDGSIILLFTERPSLSLYEVMEFLLNSDLDIDHAMNLDGGPSSGYILNSNEHKLDQASFAIPNIISIDFKNE